jgi:hypothetical protein
MSEVPGKAPEQEGKKILSQVQDSFKTLQENPYHFRVWRYALEDLIDFREKEDRLEQMEKKLSRNDSHENVLAREDAHLHFAMKKRFIADRSRHPLYDFAYEGLAKIAGDLEETYREKVDEDPRAQATSDLRQIKQHVSAMSAPPLK